MIYAAIGYWGVGLVLAIILGFHTNLAGRGIWIGLSVGLGVVAVAMTARWMRRGDLGLTVAGRADVPLTH
jgi:MATE family multidrug resistance protein